MFTTRFITTNKPLLLLFLKNKKKPDANKRTHSAGASVMNKEKKKEVQDVADEVCGTFTAQWGVGFAVETTASVKEDSHRKPRRARALDTRPPVNEVSEAGRRVTSCEGESRPWVGESGSSGRWISGYPDRNGLGRFQSFVSVGV